MAKKKTRAKKAVKRAGGTKVLGRTMGLPICGTWEAVFRQNAAAPKAERRTDEQIAKFMTSEFPGRPARDLTTPQGVRRVRSLFNRGVLPGLDAPPKTAAVGYDAAGEPIPPRARPAKARKGAR